MAGVNTTDVLARAVHGTNPQNLVEKIVRMRIYDSLYWKHHCFGLSATSLVDKAMDLQYVCGTYSANDKPSPFLCLVLKMLQIQPDLDIVVEFIEQRECKYVRALGSLSMLKENQPIHRMDADTVARVAKRAGLEAHVLRACLATAFGRLVELCVEGCTVELTVGAVGTLSCIDRPVSLSSSHAFSFYSPPPASRLHSSPSPLFYDRSQ